ncbi:Metallo-dependent phosphatase-like protein [Phaeosphaeria sp. MPI-PUGE-AT-0046c]|nr:Metallo-dependent phosphatase-like protein [Phaeosphaeria sp. MPI-PUGE-AT-0046c]
MKRSRSSSLPAAKPPLKRKHKEHETEIVPYKRVRFLIMSDTHSGELPSNLPDCDVLLHCGDLTDDGSPRSIAEALQGLSKVKAELRLVIAGNHDIALDKQYYLAEDSLETDVGTAHALISPEAKSMASKSGVIFLSEGTYRFTLSSGATFRIYASPQTLTHGASAFQYQTNEDRFNCTASTPVWAKNVGTESSIIPSDVDIVMTHGPMKYILDTTADGQSAGCEHLRRAIERVKPKLHCFGHIHTGYGAQRVEYAPRPKTEEDSDTIKPLQKEWIGKNQAAKKGYACLPPGSDEDFQQNKQTLCINAAMEGEKGTLENVPWLASHNPGRFTSRLLIGESVGPSADLQCDSFAIGSIQILHLDLNHSTLQQAINMTGSSSLVLYRSGPSSSMTTTQSPASLISSRLFSQQTGTAIATELLYRLLFDIINRFLATFQRLASKSMDEASSWIERKLQERRERLQEAKARSTNGLHVVEEVDKLAESSGFITCPIGGNSGARRQPPWVKSVLEGIEEGRLHDRDFYTNSW